MLRRSIITVSRVRVNFERRVGVVTYVYTFSKTTEYEYRYEKKENGFSFVGKCHVKMPRA